MTTNQYQSIIFDIFNLPLWVFLNSWTNVTNPQLVLPFITDASNFCGASSPVAVHHVSVAGAVDSAPATISATQQGLPKRHVYDMYRRSLNDLRPLSTKWKGVQICPNALKIFLKIFQGSEQTDHSVMFHTASQHEK